MSRRILRKAIGFLSLGCFFLSPAWALESGATWILEDFGAELKNEAEIKGLLESAGSSYDRFFESIGLVKVNDRKIKVKIFPTQMDFKKYQSDHSQSKSDQAYFSLFDLEVVTWAHSEPGLLQQNLLHEMTHDRIRTFVGDERIPRCLDEGFAEIFEVGNLNGGRIDVGPLVAEWKALIRQANQAQALKSFSFFIEMSPKDFLGYTHQKFEYLNIAQCWAQAHFLYFSNAGEFRSILKIILQDGLPQKGFDDVLRKAKLPINAKEFEEKWLAFVQGM